MFPIDIRSTVTEEREEETVTCTSAFKSIKKRLVFDIDEWKCIEYALV